jgi:hypothetical protein
MISYLFGNLMLSSLNIKNEIYEKSYEIDFIIFSFLNNRLLCSMQYSLRSIADSVCNKNWVLLTHSNLKTSCMGY